MTIPAIKASCRRLVRAAAFSVLPALASALLLGAVFCGYAEGAALPEWEVKREGPFEFERKPTVTRDGDRVTISFKARAYSDVTIAIEDARGRIVRHLASGVLGPNAPEPFEKDSLEQTVVWDGKNDQGTYIDDKDELTVRVSLGLDPKFERTLYWSPHKRISNIAPILSATPEGVYVFEGLGLDHLRFFDHEGNYVRTVYPFPRNKIDEVVDLQTHVFPQDDLELPLKLGFEEATLLSSGSSAWGGGGHPGGWGATSMAVHPGAGDEPGRIALAFHKLNWLATDGSSGGVPIRGPSVSREVRVRHAVGGRTQIVGPTSIAFCPDGKYVYMTGYVWKTEVRHGSADAFHMVKRAEFGSQDPPTIFAGVGKADGGYGSGDDRFCVPTGVATDPEGRVYVADYVNSRIQVFSPDAELLKTIETVHPAYIEIDPNTGEIWAFSMPMIGPSNRIMRETGFDAHTLKLTVTRLGTFDQPQQGEPEEIPGVSFSLQGGRMATGGQALQAAVNFWHTVEGVPTIWVVGRRLTATLAEMNWMGGGGQWTHLGGWDRRGIRIYARKDGEWTQIKDFAAVAREKVHRVTPPQFSRSMLYVNPADKQLYVCEEQTGAGKSFYTVLRINPENGRISELRLPFDAEDMIFDSEGRAYLKTDREIMRFDTQTWREIPWDYGEQRGLVRFASSGSIPSTQAIAALPIPGRRPVWWHSSGMWISPKGHLAVICNIPDEREDFGSRSRLFESGIDTRYTPRMYPGRSGSRIVQVYDRHGQLVHEDALPGLTHSHGIGIDNDDNLYIQVGANRVVNGEPYFSDKNETLLKVQAGKAHFRSAGRARVPLSPDRTPDRHPDITQYGMSRTWVKNAEWLYGGVGYGGQGGSCTCWHSRFQLDYFARSFTPETLRYRVAVLDSAGNLVLRIGRYGNVDDGLPLVRDGGPEEPRSIGGDEVAFFHPAYVGVHTDRRLFVTDWGNGRIVSVKLGYHQEETIALKDIPDGAE